MKDLKVFLIASLLSFSIFSQTEENYLTTLELIKQGFNDSNASLIHQKFDSDLKASLAEPELKTIIDSLLKEKGLLQEFDFLIDDEKEKNYLIDFENAVMMIIIRLNEAGEISTFKIKEY